MSQIYQQTYLIDAWGNRQIDANGGQTWGGVNNRTFTLPTLNGVPLTNRFGELYSDLAGNVTADFATGGDNMTFDGASRMTRAITGSLTSHYVYDASGQRVRRIIGVNETWQVFGFDGELLAEYPVASGAPSANAQREYGYRGGDMLVVAGCDVARWLIKDQIGTPRILADVTGSLANVKRHDYLPYGEEVPVALRSGTYGYATDCLRQDFTTYERDDETGLDYAQARYYASKQGRFISVDPDVSSASVSDPQTWNRYAYVGNHPLVFTDPTGLKWYYNKNDNSFVWSNDVLSKEALDAKGWAEITAATNSVVSQTGSGTIYRASGGSLIFLPTNSQNFRNLTAEVLQEARLENMQAAKELAEARTNAVILDFISKSEQGAEILLTDGGSITIRAAAKIVFKSLAQEYVEAKLDEATDGAYSEGKDVLGSIKGERGVFQDHDDALEHLKGLEMHKEDAQRRTRDMLKGDGNLNVDDVRDPKKGKIAETTGKSEQRERNMRRKRN